MAATFVNILSLSLPVSAALAQYQPVTAAGTAATAGGNAVGFAQYAATSGTVAAVQVAGVALAVAGGAINPGDAVEVGVAVTQVVTKATGVTVGRYVGTTAATAGKVIPVLVIGN